MTSLAGQLGIRLARRDGRVAVAIERPRPTRIGSYLCGRPVEEAVHLVPRLFNVCAAAQEAAVRSAFGLPISAPLAERVAGELLREHVLKLTITWPQLLGVVPDLDAPGLVRRASSDRASAVALREALLGSLGSAPRDVRELDAWAATGETAPARLFAALSARWDHTWGRADVPVFEADSAVDWPAPTQAGLAVENGPAARVADHALMRSIAQRYGHCALWRMAARLVETDRVLCGNAIAATPSPGGASAARGTMLVKATRNGGVVGSFARLSPTDFAIVPGGVLETALATLPADAGSPLKDIAQLVVETIDPCVATRLEVANA